MQSFFLCQVPSEAPSDDLEAVHVNKDERENKL